MPGRKFRRLIPALLPWRIGMLKSTSWERLLSVELLVTSTTGASPRTSMLSVLAPTFIVKETLAVLPMDTSTASRFKGRNPAISAWTS